MMRSSVLTLLFAVAMPVSLGSMACFLSTEGDGYDYETYGGTDGVCEVGQEGCDCTSGGACNPGFRCDNNQNKCFLLEQCPVGEEGCDCTPGLACDPGLLCLSDVCVKQCSPGTESCPCTDGGGCDPNLQCLSNVCVEEAADGGGSTDGGTPGTTDGGNACGNCTAPPLCPSSGDECQCDCVEECSGDDAVLCPGGASGCQEVQTCVNGCLDGDAGPECLPSADSGTAG